MPDISLFKVQIDKIIFMTGKKYWVFILSIIIISLSIVSIFLIYNGEKPQNIMIKNAGNHTTIGSFNVESPPKDTILIDNKGDNFRVGDINVKEIERTNP